MTKLFMNSPKKPTKKQLFWDIQQQYRDYKEIQFLIFSFYLILICVLTPLPQYRKWFLQPCS